MLPHIKSIKLLLPRYAVSFSDWLDSETFLSPFLDMAGRTNVNNILIDRRHGPLEWYGPAHDVLFTELRDLQLMCGSMSSQALSRLLSRYARLVSFKLATFDSLPPRPVFDINEAALALYTSKDSLKTLHLHNHAHWPGFRSRNTSLARFGLLKDFSLEELAFDVEDLGPASDSTECLAYLPPYLKRLKFSRFDEKTATWTEHHIVL